MSLLSSPDLAAAAGKAAEVSDGSLVGNALTALVIGSVFMAEAQDRKAARQHVACQRFIYEQNNNQDRLREDD